MQIVSAFISYNEGYAETLRDVSACWVKLKKNAETHKRFVGPRPKNIYRKAGELVYYVFLSVVSAISNFKTSRMCPSYIGTWLL